MPWEVKSERPARTRSSKSPNRKIERTINYCLEYNELINVVGKQTVDANKIVINFISQSEYIERKNR